MKFGKRLKRDSNPCWNQKYIDYKSLKIIIKEIKKSGSRDLTAFVSAMDTEVTKVNSFYMERESQVQSQFVLCGAASLIARITNRNLRLWSASRSGLRLSSVSPSSTKKSRASGTHEITETDGAYRDVSSRSPVVACNVNEAAGSVPRSDSLMQGNAGGDDCAESRPECSSLQGQSIARTPESGFFDKVESVRPADGVGFILSDAEKSGFSLGSFVDLCRAVDGLRSYVVLNYLAVLKIIKKLDKKLGCSTRTLFTASLVEQPFYRSRTLAQIFTDLQVFCAFLDVTSAVPGCIFGNPKWADRRHCTSSTERRLFMPHLPAGPVRRSHVESIHVAGSIRLCCRVAIDSVGCAWHWLLRNRTVVQFVERSRHWIRQITKSTLF